VAATSGIVILMLDEKLDPPVAKNMIKVYQLQSEVLLVMSTVINGLHLLQPRRVMLIL